MAVVEEVKNLFQRLIKVVKSLQMYGEDHPAVDDIFTAVFSELEDYLLSFGDLFLEVRQFGIFCDDQEIYRDDDRSSSIPFRLFSDGIRSINFHPGISSGELKNFLKLLIKEINPQEEDLATLIWERDFVHISCDIVEQGAEVPEEVEQKDYLSERPEGKIHLAYPMEEDELRKFNLPISEVALNDDEIAQLKEEVDNIEQSVYHDLIVSIQRTPISNQQTYIIFFDGFVDLAKQLLSLSDLEGIARLIRMGSREEFVNQEPLRIRFEKFVDFLNSEEFVQPFIKFIFNNWQNVDQAVASEIISLQDERSLPTLLDLYTKVKSYELKQFLAKRIVGFGNHAIDLFRKFVQNENEEKVLDAITIITDTGLKDTGDFLVELFSFPSSDVKMKAIEAMIALGEGDALSNITRLITDPNESVRIATVKAIAQFGAKRFADFLFEIITSDDFKDRSYEEKRAFVFSYCDVVKDDAIDFFEKALTRWNPMKGSHTEEMRNLAALGLGRIGTAESMAVLLKGSKSRRKSIKKASGRGLKLFEKRGLDEREGTEEEE